MTSATTAFLHDHPHQATNVFLMMRFAHTPLRERIRDNLVTAARSMDFDAIRADDRDYTGEMWKNVRLCMDNCALGVAVFDRTDEVADGQNLLVELGYMLALKRPCLILRQEGMESPPVILAHRLHRPFDPYDVEGTLTRAVTQWLSGQHPNVSRL